MNIKRYDKDDKVQSKNIHKHSEELQVSTTELTSTKKSFNLDLNDRRMKHKRSLFHIKVVFTVYKNMH